VLLRSTVEARTPRRRASKLLPILVPPAKVKTRTLVLTTRRLVCLKMRHKGVRGVSIKAEFALRAGEKGKDGRSVVVVSVEPLGEREFVIMTVSHLRLLLSWAHAVACSRPSRISTLLRTLPWRRLGYR
jgi:3-phosphoinositide dependent protein kinase-1